MDILNLAISTVPIAQSVEYSCVLFNNWSGVNHPIDYGNVAGTAHWTPPVLLAHSKFADLWSHGDMASPGIENVAETGSTFTLQTEIEVLQTKGLAGDMVIGSNQFNARDPPQVFENITLGPNFPYLSAISMMGPSPDWFSGLSSFCPRGPGGFWFQSFEIATYPFDAGTEQGDTYSINNNPESPHGPIFQLTKDTVPESGILLDPTGTKVLPVMTWKCALTIDTNEEEETLLSGEELGLMEESNPFRSEHRIGDNGRKETNGGLRGLRENDN